MERISRAEAEAWLGYFRTGAQRRRRNYFWRSPGGNGADRFIWRTRSGFLITRQFGQLVVEH